MKTCVSVILGDLTQQSDLDVIVNAANSELAAGGGVCGSIFKAAGWALMQQSCNWFHPDEDGTRCRTGHAKITSAHMLPNKAVIHAVGPIWDSTQVEVMELQLESAYRNSLLIADDNGFTSIGFPAISCGIYGYPHKIASATAMRAIQKYLTERPNTNLKEIRFVIFPGFRGGDELFDIFQNALRG